MAYNLAQEKAVMLDKAVSEIEPAIEAAIARVAAELAEIAQAVARLEITLQLIASAAVVK
jgi:hypothetical protein